MTTAPANPVVVMGVCGCGKSTVGRRVADLTGGVFLDADDFHPAANVAKMRAGQPLTDDDRWPWLDRLNEVLREQVQGGRLVVLACSALREVYRQHLAQGLPHLRFVHLYGSYELLWARLQARTDHYMPASLLQSQFATLEEPTQALRLEVSAPPEALAQAVVERLALAS